MHACSDHNIYKDPAPSENAKAQDVVRNLLTRVHHLLSEWPDHPTLTQACCNICLRTVLILDHLNISDLLQIVKACDKLMSLDLQVPVMKVLAGLEYILKKAQVV